MGKSSRRRQREQQKHFKKNGIFSLSGNGLSQHTLELYKHYVSSDKRTITFNGEAPHEVMNLTDDILCFNGFTGCFLSIIGTASDCQDLETSLIFRWVREDEPVMFLKLHSNNDVASFALLHKTDYDPYEKHKVPYVLDYIYTYEKYRNKGHAQSLINRIKQQYEFTAFCSSDLSRHVFHQCGLENIGMKHTLHVMRTV